MSSLEEVSVFLYNTKKFTLAQEVILHFAKFARSFEQLDDIAKCFFKIKDYENSIKFADMALQLANPEQMYTIRHNLSNCYNHINYPEKALKNILINEKLIPKDHDRDFEKSYAYFLLNRKSEAAEIVREKENDPTISDKQREMCQFNIGTYDLIDGKLQEGLKRFLISSVLWGDNYKLMEKEFADFNIPKWNGIISPGINLIIAAEAGIGDEIINFRFAKRIEDLGMNVIWLTLESRKDLQELYEFNGIKSYCSLKDIPKAKSVYIPAMQLPIHLNCNYDNLFTGNYLNPKYITENLLPKNKLNIGIRWQGNPEYDQDLHRSIPLKEIMNHIPDKFNLYSLQRDNGLEELEEFPNVVNLEPYLKTIHNLIDYLWNLDVIITSCTSIAHFAAAMGKRTIVIVPISCYYLWCNPTKESPWYGDNLTVLYQEVPRSWDIPLAQLEDILNAI